MNDKGRLVEYDDVHEIVEHAVDNAATKIARFMQGMMHGKLLKHRQGRTFTFPFEVDEKHLRTVAGEVKRQLADVPIDGEPEFLSTTRFQDLSTLVIHCFDEFLERAGNQRDPEAASLEWNKFALTPEGSVVAGKVCIDFVTEKRLLTQDLGPGDTNHAVVVLKVEGSDSRWVEQTYNALAPYITSARLGGIYRPLWFFRNGWFVNVLSMILSWAGFYTGISIA